MEVKLNNVLGTPGGDHKVEQDDDLNDDGLNDDGLNVELDPEVVLRGLSVIIKDEQEDEEDKKVKKKKIIFRLHCMY